MNGVARREPDPCLCETELSGRERHPNGSSFDGTQRVGRAKRMAVHETEKKRGYVNGTSNGEITKQALNLVSKVTLQKEPQHTQLMCYIQISLAIRHPEICRLKKYNKIRRLDPAA
ncbi:hypothetical protein RJT34_03376 [Clitoria ternatea]|uniref:Uncharacterized protein n=1 Tax=Clitoria ternatea TaxID=43366 RepID=A0AAN9KLJ9_CLITE